MLTGIDHLVVAVPDLGTAIARYTALGFTVVPGGRHPTGTHNALVAFADGAYLELIAFYEDRSEHRWWRPLQRGGGLIDFCLGTDDLTADIAAFRALGVGMDDPRPLSRLRPDGEQVRWRLGIPAEGFRGVMPFLIEDVTPRSTRVPGATRHANGARGVQTLTVAVEDPAAAAGAYTRLLGRPAETVEVADWGARGVRVRVGDHRLDFLAPARATSPIAAWVGDRGPSPYAVALAGANSLVRPDPGDTLGVRLSIA